MGLVPGRVPGCTHLLWCDGTEEEGIHDLRQKFRSVSEYIGEFTNLSRYAPDDIDTDAKRKEKFLEGLNDVLSIPLSVAYTPTFQSLLD
jgi:hypothetical protein